MPKQPTYPGLLSTQELRLVLNRIKPTVPPEDYWKLVNHLNAVTAKMVAKSRAVRILEKALKE